MEELFKRSEELQKQSIDLEREYYKNVQKINTKLE